MAQEEVVATLDEIVVVGTRRKGRTAIETAVPIDVFNRVCRSDANAVANIRRAGLAPTSVEAGYGDQFRMLEAEPEANVVPMAKTA